MTQKDNKVQIGICFRREHPPETILPYAQQAEALGFDEIWVVEDCFYASGVAPAAAILASTDHIRVGVGIMPAVARNPVFSAMEIATIGRMYPQRFTAGIGHGVERWMRQIGAFPPSPLRALREGVEIIRDLMQGKTVDRKGEQFQLEGGVLVYPPSAIPPVYLGVRGPKSLNLAGEIADGTLLAEFSSPAYVRWAREQIAQGNRSGDPHHVAVFVLSYACSEREEGRALLRPLIAKAVASGTKDIYFTSIGAEELLRELQQIGNAEEIARRIPNEWIDQMALIGTPADWQRTIEQFLAAGADTIILMPLPSMGLDQVERFAMNLSD